MISSLFMFMSGAMAMHASTSDDPMLTYYAIMLALIGWMLSD